MASLRTYVPLSLQQVVKSFWFLEIPELTDAFYEERIIPDGHQEIIFHLDSQGGKRLLENYQWTNEPAAFITGQTLKNYSLRLLPGARLYGIRFYPHTLHALFNIPASEFTDQVRPLEDITSPHPFWNCISDTPDKTFVNFENLIAARLQSAILSANSFKYVDAAVSEILQHKGDLSMDRLIRRTGISVKYLDTLFSKYVGVNPKVASNIIRFNHFIQYRNRFPEKSLTECSYEAGYYDQSHLIKAFQAFTGSPPKAYFLHSNHINDLFVNL